MDGCQFYSECAIKIEKKNDSALTDLHVAVKNDDLENVKYLLNLGADVNKKTRPCLPEAVEMKCDCGNIKYCFHRGDEFGNEMKGGDVVAQNALHLAAKHGSAELVELLLPFIDNINEASGDNSTALHYATQNRVDGDTDVRVAQLLLKHGADLEARNRDGKTPLFLAVKLEKAQLVNFLLCKGADPNASTLTLSTPLYSALMNDNAELISSLLQHGASASGNRNNHDEEPLFYALRILGRGQSRLRIVSLLLDAGVLAGATNDQGSTALHVAVQENDSLLTELLLDRSSPLAAKDRFDMTPLAVAVCTNRAEIARLLLERGAPADDFVGKSSVLQHAIMRRNEALVRLLLEHGADPNFGSGRDKPITAACLHKNTRIMEMLIGAGADVNYKDTNGRTPLMTAVREPNYAMMRYLLKHGANLNDSDNLGNTSFHVLFENNSYNKEAIIEYFIDAAADLNVENLDGLTPFSCMLMSCFTKNEVLVFLKHIALLLAFGKHVNPKITSYIEERGIWSQKFKSYSQELENMKMAKILGEYTYFHIISSKYKQLISLFQEKDVLRIFEMGLRENNFTTYHKLLTKHFYYKHERFRLTKYATCVLSAIFRTQLPLEIVEKIVEYLPNEGMMNFYNNFNLSNKFYCKYNLYLTMH